jgi:hypothetical protein
MTAPAAATIIEQHSNRTQQHLNHTMMHPYDIDFAYGSILLQAKCLRGGILVRFGLDMSGPTEVKIGYAELIRNNFKLFDF